jgi:hypothetical protein
MEQIPAALADDVVDGAHLSEQPLRPLLPVLTARRHPCGRILAGLERRDGICESFGLEAEQLHLTFPDRSRRVHHDLAGLVHGPLACDNAGSPAAAAEKSIVSKVAAQADILVVPDLEAGNLLAKQLTFLAGADAAGIVLGVRVPIILTSRTDAERTRLASCAVAVLIARRQAEVTTTTAGR